MALKTLNFTCKTTSDILPSGTSYEYFVLNLLQCCAAELVAIILWENCLIFIAGQDSPKCKCDSLWISLHHFIQDEVLTKNHHTFFGNGDREIQASGHEGPIPPSISVLNNLTELWVFFF